VHDASGGVPRWNTASALLASWLSGSQQQILANSFAQAGTRASAADVPVTPCNRAQVGTGDASRVGDSQSGPPHS